MPAKRASSSDQPAGRVSKKHRATNDDGEVVSPSPAAMSAGMALALPVFTCAENCTDCGTTFSLFQRRHHCRNCGDSFCSTHASNFVSLLRFDLTIPQRTCDGCVSALKRATQRGWESTTSELPATAVVAGIRGLELRCDCLVAAVKQLKVSTQRDCSARAHCCVYHRALSLSLPLSVCASHLALPLTLSFPPCRSATLPRRRPRRIRWSA